MDRKRTYNRYAPAREIYFSQAEAARRYGVSLMTIWRYAHVYKLIGIYLRPVGRDHSGNKRYRKMYKESELNSIFTPRSIVSYLPGQDAGKRSVSSEY